jgi:hypothetical protein
LRSLFSLNFQMGGPEFMVRKRRESSRNVARGVFATLWILLGGFSGLYLWDVFSDPSALGKQVARFNSITGETPGSTSVHARTEGDSEELAEIKASLRELSQQMADMDLRIAALHNTIGAKSALPVTAPPPPAPTPAPPAPVAASPAAPVTVEPPGPVTVEPPAPVTVSPPPAPAPAAVPAAPPKPVEIPVEVDTPPEPPKPMQHAAGEAAPKPAEQPKPVQEPKPAEPAPVAETDAPDGPPEPNPVAVAPLDEPADEAESKPAPVAADETANQGAAPSLATPPASAPPAAAPDDAAPPEETETARLDPVTLPPAANDGTTRYGIELGSVNKQDALRPLWREFLTNHAALVAGLQPRRVLAPDKTWRLIAGPFANASEAEGACALFKKASKPCEATVYAGDGL